MSRYRVELGDSRERLRELPEASVDAVVTDPPYQIAFMGQKWDASGVAYDVALWREAFRVLKPGGHLLAFGATRTFHRVACAIEDAGFEVRDSITWIYSSGFPKSLNVRKALEKSGAVAGAEAWSGWGTALKPASEPVVVARKPLEGTVAANVLAHGVGGINVDGCRVPHASAADLERHAAGVAAIKARGGSMAGSWKNSSDLAGANDVSAAGRWPPNVLFSHRPECSAEECVDECAVAELDGATSDLKARANKRQSVATKSTPVLYGPASRSSGAEYNRGDSGGASRFFPAFRYVAKASRREKGAGNEHPTVKPLALMRWLVRLVAPRGGVVLDPFTGSGSTGVACILEDVRFIGVELSPNYRETALRRMDSAAAGIAGEQFDLFPEEVS